MTPHFYNHPLFIVNEPMLTSGYTKDLVYGQLGIFYNSTRSAVDGSLKGNQPVILAAGSYHTKEKLSDYNQGLKQSIKTVAFLPTDIISFRKSPILSAVAEEVVMGYDGTNPTETLEFFCGKHYQFQIRVWGEDVNNIMLHPIVRTISLDTECCDEECTTGCTPFQLGTDFYTKQLVEKINSDVELKKFVKAEAILSGLTPKTTSYTKWNLTVADTGDITALGVIGATYNSVAYIDPVRESRNGIYSTYTMYMLTSAGTPSAFTPTAPLSLEACGTCPSGYTTVAATDTYMVVRPLSGSTDLTSAAAQDNYADLVGTDYGVSIDANKTFYNSFCLVVIRCDHLAVKKIITAHVH